jgi:hypothetical protein
MRLGARGCVVLTLVLFGTTEIASATTWHVTCPGGAAATTLAQGGGAAVNFPQDPGGLTGTGNAAGAPDALGALLGTPSQGTENLPSISGNFSTSLAGGDTVEITGLCQQEIEVRTSGITIAGPTGSSAPAATPPDSSSMANGIQGQVQVVGAQRVTFNGVLLGSTSGTVTLPTNYSPSNIALLWAHDGAAVSVINSVVRFSPIRGVYASRSASIVIHSSTIADNSIGQTVTRFNSAIEVTDASAVTLGTPPVVFGTSTNDDPVAVTNNAGDGIFASRGGAVVVYAATISGNGQKQIRLFNGSSARISGGGANPPLSVINAPVNSSDEAVGAIASTVLIEQGASIVGGSGGSAVALNGGSAGLIQGSQISGGNTTIQASGTSTLALAGGNLICHGAISGGVCSPTAGTAIVINHVGALIQVNGLADFNYTPAQDIVFGTALVQLQSTFDIGAGLISGQPSIVWTTGAGGIVASQNSSLRLQGGAQVNGTIALLQGSNGFFNKSQGGSNTVTGGVSCAWTSIPSAHIAVVNGSLSPAPTLIGNILSASGLTTQCLAF